jgi:hypothetical protein
MEYKMKKVKVNKYQVHPELENKIVEVTIINNEKNKPIVKKPTTPKKPKLPRMTINQLALEMRAGFAAVNQKIDKEVGEIKETLKRHEEILMRHEEKLK